MNKLPSKKQDLYRAIEEFSDGKEDIYFVLKNYIYQFIYAKSEKKQKTCISMILFFTDNNQGVVSAINNYLLESLVED